MSLHVVGESNVQLGDLLVRLRSEPRLLRLRLVWHLLCGRTT